MSHTQSASHAADNVYRHELSYTVFQGNSGTYKNKGSTHWNFVPDFGLRKFRCGILMSNGLSTQFEKGGDAHNVINWT